MLLLEYTKILIDFYYKNIYFLIFITKALLPLFAFKKDIILKRFDFY